MRKLGVLLLLLGLPPVQAQVPDPTRPPAQMMTPDAGGSVVATPAESGMQTVILRRNGKSGAVINGQYVEVGGMAGDKRVVRISENEVVLKGEGGREVVKLLPAAAKTPVAKASAGTGAKRRSTGTTEK